MALTVKDILELPSGQKLQLLAGGKGLNKTVTSVEIADYEFAPDLEFAPGAAPDLSRDMDPQSFIITSFLFAKDDPSVILSAVKAMEEMGMAALAFKRIIYEELPEEVLAFADQHGFPILSFGRDVWFENIIFDIMYAVQFDDKIYLSEEKIDSMLSGYMNRSELDIILKGISLRLRPWVSVVFIADDILDAGRILRGFYLLKGFHSKGLMVRYGRGLFLITTSTREDHQSHDLIRREAFELLGIDESIPMGMSDVHESTSLDRAFREGWQCYIASIIEGRRFDCFRQAGICRVLLPSLGNEDSTAFAKDVLDAFADNRDLRETADAYTACGGDISKTASALHCHPNTIRYRLGRIRELTGLQDVTDSELYLQLKTALLIRRAGRVVRGGGSETSGVPSPPPGTI